MLADGREPTAAEPQTHPAVAATVARLETTPATPWRLDDRAYLGRLFLARVRAEQAATLLAHSPRSAAQIGTTVGWGDTFSSSSSKNSGRPDRGGKAIDRQS